MLGLSCLLVIVTLVLNRLRISDSLVNLLVGIMFATGLVLSGMVKRHVVIDFLTFYDGWNP
mgnify:CR=1 FL=1